MKLCIITTESTKAHITWLISGVSTFVFFIPQIKGHFAYYMKWLEPICKLFCTLNIQQERECASTFLNWFFRTSFRVSGKTIGIWNGNKWCFRLVSWRLNLEPSACKTWGLPLTYSCFPGGHVTLSTWWVGLISTILFKFCGSGSILWSKL